MRRAGLLLIVWSCAARMVFGCGGSVTEGASSGTASTSAGAGGGVAGIAAPTTVGGGGEGGGDAGVDGPSFVTCTRPDGVKEPDGSPCAPGGVCCDGVCVSGGC